MIKKDISQIAVQMIKQIDMKPASKVLFDFRKIMFWSLVGAMVFAGSLSFAVILFLLINNDWSLYGRLGPGFILKTLPYFWFVFLTIFIFLGEYYYKKTTFGYRYQLLTIIAVYVLVTVLFGSVMYVSGLGENIEEKLNTNVPVYRSMMFDQQNAWSQPEKGLLAGTILSLNGSSIEIIDFNNVIWNIDISSAFIQDRVELSLNEIIKIIGNIEENGLFKADEIRPWMGRGSHKMLNSGGMMKGLR